tara:strand:+ start:672 stop:1829 length:1158 start_codon:yes stop_codon:yes gene_type:complete
MKNLILGYERGRNKWETIHRALLDIGQDADVVVEDFDKIEGPYDRIITVAESLLPIQAELEKKWGLSNLSIESANILSDKKLMDDFCISIGLENLIPDSVIPKSPSDLDIFKDRPFIIKPTIGSGTKQHRSFDYVTFNNQQDFLQTIDDSFFEDNKKGYAHTLFNNRTSYYMAQEQLHIEADLYGPYYYGKNNILWVKCKIVVNKIDEYSYETRCLSWMSIPTNSVPIDVRAEAQMFMDTITDELQLKNMFFSGPDYYKWGSNVKLIDANPRLGQGLQIINSMHDYTIIPKILSGKTFTIENHFLWKISTLKPGRIKSISDTSHLSEHLARTNRKVKPGMIIPEFQHTQMDGFRMALYIKGTNESDMLKTYETVNAQLQDCIEYY